MQIAPTSEHQTASGNGHKPITLARWLMILALMILCALPLYKERHELWTFVDEGYRAATQQSMAPLSEETRVWGIPCLVSAGAEGRNLHQHGHELAIGVRQAARSFALKCPGATRIMAVAAPWLPLAAWGLVSALVLAPALIAAQGIQALTLGCILVGSLGAALWMRDWMQERIKP